MKQEVIVTDIQMPFGSMVVFMIKWALAAIPAIIILFFIGSFAFGLISGLSRAQALSKLSESESSTLASRYGSLTTSFDECVEKGTKEYKRTGQWDKSGSIVFSMCRNSPTTFDFVQ